MPFDQLEEHDRFDSRRCKKLYWTTSSVFKDGGAHKATLLDPADAVV